MEKKKILIVDDEVDLLATSKMALEREGYEVLTVASGLEGLNAVRQECPDLVILDVMMPGIGGYSVLKEIKKHLALWPKKRSTAILIATGKGEGLRDLFEAEGVAGVLTKPFGVDQLIDRVKIALRCQAHE